MPASFPRWSNSLLAVSVAALAGLAVGGVLFLWGLMRTPYVTGQRRPIEQPVAFDHRHHVGDDGIDCRYCHELAWRGPTAGVPPTERCLGCHAQIWNESPLLAPVWASWREGRPIVWRRVHRLPDFVYFDHSAHVLSGVSCETCHGRVDRMARVFQVAPLTMSWCLDCHRSTAGAPRAALARATGATLDVSVRGDVAVGPGTDCTTCHR